MKNYFKNDIVFISNCCGAYMPDYPDSDICSECGEHCKAISEEDLDQDD
jgi:hypothetical protein